MLNHAQRIVLITIALTLLTEPFVPMDLSMLVSFLGIALFLIILPTLKPKSRRLPLILISAGILVIVITSQPFSVFLEGTSSMLDIVSILLIMQLFSIPIALGTYTRDLEFLLFKFIRKEQGLYFFTTIITHFFSTFLLFGTIPVMLSLLGEPLKNNVKNYERFVATAMSRGYALMISWSPGAVMFLLVTSITNSEWHEVFLPGIMLSFIGIATSVFLEGKFTLAKENIANSQKQRSDINEKEAWTSVLHIACVVSGMITIIYFLEKSKMFPSTYCVMLAGLIVFLVWMIKFIKHPDLKKVLKNYWQQGLLKAVDLAITFVAIGILTVAVKNANLINYFYDLFRISDLGLTVIIIIPIAVIIIALLGLHPMISISIVGSIFMAAHNVVPAVAISLALLLGAIISFVLAPLTGIILTLANYLNQKSSRIALHWNSLFSAVFLLEGIILIYLWISFFV